jgi:thioredoxin 1
VVYLSSVVDLNSKNWEKEVLKSDILVLVDFWHQRCSWCVILNPIIEEISSEYRDRVKFTKLDVMDSRENQEMAIKYGIMATPTLVFFCDGRPIESVAGFQSKEDLTKLLNEIIMKHRECIEKSTILS